MDSSSYVRGRVTRLSALAATAGLIVAGGMSAAAADASAWTQDTTPVPTGGLLAVARVDQHTTWAAGYSETFDGKAAATHPLLLAGDGHGTWQRVATPADDADSRINALSARGPGDVWLVGDNTVDASEQGTPVLTEHWDGGSWQVASAPVPARTQSAGLLGVTAAGPDDAWAAGWATIVDELSVDPVTGMTTIKTHNTALLEHWDGAAWHLVALPPGRAGLILNAVAAAGPDDVWATGETADGTDQPVALHYDGRAWRAAALPKTGEYGELNAVAAAGPDDVWAVGRTVLDDADSGHPLVEHWDGRSWQAVAAPGTGQLQGVAITGSGPAVVGYDQSSGATYGESLADGRWTSLGLPSVGDVQAIASTASGLVATGAYGVPGQQGPSPLVLASGE